VELRDRSRARRSRPEALAHGVPAQLVDEQSARRASRQPDATQRREVRADAAAEPIVDVRELRRAGARGPRHLPLEHQPLEQDARRDVASAECSRERGDRACADLPGRHGAHDPGG
jgi:hypothetical protein